MPRTWSFLPPLGIAGLERAMDTGDQLISALGMAELAVALRRFRQAHGFTRHSGDDKNQSRLSAATREWQLLK